ncbi:hypothetical protein [Neisseria mucosa]|nr:hypothetical protein [Neisseria mucosa]
MNIFARGLLYFPQRSSENRFIASPHAYGYHQKFRFQTTFPI